MPAKPYAYNELKKIVTTSPITSNFRHLLPVNKAYLKATPDGNSIKAAPVKDRIKWWNIVPGDRVRVAQGNSSVVREVLGINKLTNRVYIKSDKKEGDVDQNRSPFKRQNPSKNVHYSAVQLYIGDYNVHAKDHSGLVKRPVFAKRISTTTPRWENGRWVWERFAVATVPRPADWNPFERPRVPIPWPELPKPPQIEPTSYDTPHHVVAEVTYNPSLIPDRPSALQAVGVMRKKCADDYVRMLRSDLPYDQSAFATELLITGELVNPHSRQKKRLRYQTALARQRELLREYVETELKALNGRTRREARAEATYRWRARVDADRKAELKRRWVVRGQEARLMRRKERQTKKLDREKRRLRDLVLTMAKNQIVPEAQL